MIKSAQNKTSKPISYLKHNKLMSEIMDTDDLIESIRNLSIDDTDPNVYVVSITVPLEFEVYDYRALKLAQNQPAITLPFLKRIYFNEHERFKVHVLHRFSVNTTSYLKNDVLHFKFLLPKNELTAFGYAISHNMWDLALSSIIREPSIVKKFQVELFFNHSVFKNTKSNDNAQEIMKIIIMEDCKYYKKLKGYLRKDLKKELAPYGSADDFNII